MPLRYGDGPASFELSAKRRKDYISNIRTGRRRPYCVTPLGYFMPKVRKTETCWLWTGATIRGYGSTRVAGQPWVASRLMWTWANGPIPDGLDVLHHCDNPPCVRPDHLFLGTARDNTADARAKGRLSLGSHQPLAKLNEAKVIHIRGYLDNGGTLTGIASRFGVSSSTIAAIRDGRLWKQVAA
jgi:hypothetical protein